MAFKKYRELLFGVFILAFMIFYFVMTLQLKQTPGKIGATTVPYILCAGMLILGVLQVLEGVRAMRLFSAEGEQRQDAQHETGGKALLITVSLIVLYLAMFRMLGFILATFLYLTAQFCVLTPAGQKPKYLLYVVIAAAAAVLIYMGFRYGLNLMLPRGLLKGV